MVAPAPLRAAPNPPRTGGGLLSPAFLDELRARTALSALIGRSVRLQKAGREYKGCCPFHDEKTPSFYVNDEKAFYHCFGCGAHGDAIRFLTEARGLPFMDAVRELAAAAGLELPAPDPQARARAEQASGLAGLNQQAAAWFARQLDGLEGAEARAYLDGRGIGANARQAFGLGFAPDGRQRLAAAIEGAGEDDLVEAGLLIRPDSGPAYDRFRGRLMIPIRDPRGRVIAFGGRIIGAKDARGGEPKYLNSPETPLFDKGRTLFNLDRAGPIARKADRVIVVEGYLDVIALDQTGIGEAVAPLGTALTEAQMARLWQLVDAPLLCFDGDAAGRKAGLRAAERALAVLRPGKSLRFAMLPPGVDPDDLVRQGGAGAFEEAIANPVPLDLLLYQAERARGDMARPEARAGLRQRLNELALRCADRLVAEEYRRSFTALFFEEFGWKREERRAVASAIVKAAVAAGGDPRDALIRSILYGLTRNPALIGAHIESLSLIAIDKPDLARWRDTLVEVALRGLDSDGIAAILEATLLPEAFQLHVSRDLRLKFLRDDIRREEGERQLSALIDTLAEEDDLNRELAILAAEAVAAFSGGVADADRFRAAATAAQANRQRRAALYEAAAVLGGG